MRYVYKVSGRPVEMPMLPGLSFHSDQWHRRAVTSAGFRKTQVLAQEWTLSKPSDTPRACTARGSPRVAKLKGSGARLNVNLLQMPTSNALVVKQHAKKCAAKENETRQSEFSSAYEPKRCERPGVLRFAAYIEETVDWQFSCELGAPETPGQHVRKCVVLYHLEDGSVEVIEERAANSGVGGGQFFARAPPATAGMRSPCECGPQGLRVGGTLDFLGQIFHLVDADGFTREWYKRMLDIDQPEPTAYPPACPEEYRAEHATKLGRASGKVSYGKFGGKEVCRTSPEAARRHAQMAKERQFYGHNGEVLTFVANWRDPSPGGETHEYVLHFHLSNKGIEIVVPPQQGFDRFTHLLVTQRLPANWRAMLDGAEPKYVDVEDLVVGKSLDVYGRTIDLVDCTPFTRAFYKQQLGIEQPRGQPHTCTRAHFQQNFAATVDDSTPRTPSALPGQLGATKPTRLLRKATTPQAAAAQAEEADAQAAHLALENPFCATEEPKKSLAVKQLDLAKKTRLKDAVVRCRLRQVVSDYARKNCPAVARDQETRPRTFVATYFLADDHVAIFEDHVNNSGVLGGAFLKKGRYKIIDGESTRFLLPTDFKLANIIKFSANNNLRVIDIDAASIKTMASLPDIFPFAAVPLLLEKCKNIDDLEGYSSIDTLPLHPHDLFALKVHFENLANLLTLTKP